MKAFKSPYKNLCAGSSFLEVMIAIFIIGLMLTSLLQLQNSSYVPFMKYIYKSDCILLMSTELEEQKIVNQFSIDQANSFKSLTKTIGNPLVNLTYQQTKPLKGSSLHNVCNIVIKRLECSWDSIVGKQQEKLISIGYVPYEDKP